MTDGFNELGGLVDDFSLAPFAGDDNAQKTECRPFSSSVSDLFFPRLEQRHAVCTQITDLSHSLPNHSAHDILSSDGTLSAKAILAKLDCNDLSLNPSFCEAPTQESQQCFDAELFSSVYDDQCNPMLQLPCSHLEPTDVYGRVTCYDGKIVLQLRLLNLNTNFPINVSECWLCQNKLQNGSQMYTHKHMFNGIFQVNDEYIHIIIPEHVSDVQKPGSSSEPASSKPSNSSGRFVAREERNSQDNFVLPHLTQACRLEGNGEFLKNSTDPKVSSKNNDYENSTVTNLHDVCHPSNDISLSHLEKIDPCFSSAKTSNASLLQSLDNFGAVENFSAAGQMTRDLKCNKSGTAKRKVKGKKENGGSEKICDLSNEKDVVSILNDLKRTRKHSNEDKHNSSIVLPPTKKKTGSVNFLESFSDSSNSTLFMRPKETIDNNILLIQKIMNRTENITCKHCAKSFGRNLSSYKKHMIETHKEPENSIYECPVCFRQFGSHKHLCQHVRVHAGLKGFKCSTCGSCYGRESTLRRHELSHSNTRPHTCSVCPKAFTRAQYLTAHMQAHNRTRHVCHKCGIVCSSKYNTEIHMKKHLKEKPFLCELCNKSFVRSDFLDNHMEAVHKRNRPKCTICGNIFARKDILKRHMTTHSKPSFDCKFCLRSFSRKDRLLSHKRTHEVNKELKCFKCPAAFNRREVLLKHEKLHETKHQCDKCFKFAVSEEKLLIHLKCHENGGRSQSSSSGGHPCETCGKVLRRADLLRKHVLRLHGVPLFNEATPAAREKKFICDICSKGFTRSCNLRTHVLKVHTSGSIADDDDDLDQLNSALTQSRHNHQSNLVDLSSWSSGKHQRSESYISQLTNTINSGRSLLAVSNSSDGGGWYNQSGSASPGPTLGSNLPLTSLNSQHPHSPLNLSAEAITAAAYLLAYPSYLGPYQ